MKVFSAKNILIVLISSFLNIKGLIFVNANAVEINSHLSERILPMNFRLAFMSGHVEVGIELYKLNELKMAAPHLLHPVSETHIEERKGLDKLGFKEDVFRQVSNSLDNNQTASEIDSLLLEASNNLSEMAEKIGGERKEIIRFLLKLAYEEYDLSFSENKIVNLAEYQDAWGFIKVASYHAKNISDQKVAKVVDREIKKLRKYWIKGPLPVETPVKPSTIKNAIESVLKQL